MSSSSYFLLGSSCPLTTSAVDRVPQSGLLPRRVLDLGKNEGRLDGDIQLVEPPKISAPYVALSHCWVKRTVPSTTTENRRAHLDHISFGSLPQTFQEAIKVCRWLAIRYLWIDSLCIIQNDPVDWEQQAAKMDSIYENAFFSIAAHGHAGSSRIPTYSECKISTELPGLKETVRARMVPVHDFLSPVGVIMGSIGETPPDEISGEAGVTKSDCFLGKSCTSQALRPCTKTIRAASNVSAMTKYPMVSVLQKTSDPT